MARIIIVGGSLGGLLAANMLVRDGHEVQVLEKAVGPLDGRGAGIVTHDALIDGLRRAGARVDDTLGVRVEWRVALDADGGEASRVRMPQVLTSWSRLYQLLHEALPPACYLQGVAVRAVLQDDAGVTAQCDDGRRFDGDMLIASDGIRSAVRACLAPAVQPEYAGYVAWRGVCDEATLSERTLDSVFPHFGFGLPPGEQLIGYPVAGLGNTIESGRRRYNFVWYRAADERTDLAALLTDADGRHHAGGIAPSKVSWRHIAAMREASRRLLAPQFAEIMEKTAQPFLQPIYDVWSERIAFDRVALMGDASFVARPHVGMGVTKASDDAQALADCVRVHGAGAQAAAAYQARRLAAGQAVVQRGRELGAYMQAQGARQQGARREIDTVLRETAVDPRRRQAAEKESQAVG